MKNKIVILFGLMLTGLAVMGQTSSFEGTFLNGNNSISIQFKQVGQELHGMLATAGASFAIRAERSGNQLQGKIYGLSGPIDFSAQLSGTNMTFAATGYNESYYKYSDQHSLGAFDLTPYMVDFSTANNQQNNSTNNSGYGGYGNGQSSGNANISSPYPDLNNQEIQNIVAGSQLVFYQRTSYVNDSMASSITYVNFCANGTFTINYDGSFSVEGNYGGNAHGASKGSKAGYWKLVSYQGQPAVYLQYFNGETTVNAFNINDIRQGRWRRGNTQYALQRNKVNCN